MVLLRDDWGEKKICSVANAFAISTHAWRWYRHAVGSGVMEAAGFGLGYAIGGW